MELSIYLNFTLILKIKMEEMLVNIALEVERLKKAQVDGIVLDVRDDGGGSLSTVVDIAGLFIEQGPIVQIKSAGRKKEVLYDRDKRSNMMARSLW
jgi:C-terminal processing protease CtpA/Prc